jgi:polar amino acid transport system substrate-binding protein
MKRLIAVLLMCICCAATACTALNQFSASSSSGTGTPVFDRILERGKLVVGTSGNQPPLNARASGGKIIGFEPDLAAAMAAAMGVELELVAMPFSELLPALRAGKLDMILSGMTMTAERNMKVAFVGPYFVSGKAVLTKSEIIASAEDSRALDNPDTTLAALRGSTSQTFVEKRTPQAKVVLTTDYDEAVYLVINGKVDALVADLPFCLLSTLRHPKERMKTLVAPLTFEPLGVALPAQDPLFVNWVHNYLLLAKGTGALDELQEYWFENPAWLLDLR